MAQGVQSRPTRTGPIAAASAKRLRPAIVVAVGLMLLWLVAYWNLSPLSWDLVQLSRQGPRALALYVTGHYRDAARAYRAGQQGMLPVPYMNDPAGYWALRAGHIGEAERRAQATLALVPTAVEPRITLGEIALDRGQPADAVTASSTPCSADGRITSTPSICTPWPWRAREIRRAPSRT